MSGAELFYLPLVGELLLVAPVGRAENAKERIWICPLNLLHRAVKRSPDIRCCLPNIVPVITFGNDEAVNLKEQ